MADRSVIDRAFDAFDRLSTREKLMVGGLGTAVLITAVVLVWLLVGKKLQTLEQRNENMRTTLADVQMQKDEYLRAKARLDAWKKRLDDNDLKLVKVMEDEAGKLGFEIEDFKENKRVLTENYRRRKKRNGTKDLKDLVERSQTVTIRRVSLEQLATFLSRLEGRREPVKVTQLNVAAQSSDRQVLREVRMTVATYRNEEVEN
ncbi:MAG: type II secretion system protein M [Myxococcales bacterium]|nr:type II secretion system protein M [Myxococcales bacterium]MCB9522123.1 type II secretion system protein M [Myxococcales bacterium]